LGQFGIPITQTAGLSGTTGRVGFGVKKDEEVAIFSVRREIHFLAILILGGQRGQRETYLHHLFRFGMC
jgi:hypothetical protein